MDVKGSMPLTNLNVNSANTSNDRQGMFKKNKVKKKKKILSWKLWKSVTKNILHTRHMVWGNTWWFVKKEDFSSRGVWFHLKSETCSRFVGWHLFRSIRWTSLPAPASLLSAWRRHTHICFQLRCLRKLTISERTQSWIELKTAGARFSPVRCEKNRTCDASDVTCVWLEASYEEEIVTRRIFYTTIRDHSSGRESRNIKIFSQTEMILLIQKTGNQ